MTPKIEIVKVLVRLAALIDALWMPWRHVGSNSAAAAVMERRRDFRRRKGLALPGGGSDQSRKSHSRTLAEARGLKLVTARGDTTRPIVGFTQTGELMARGLASTGLVCHARPVLKRLAALTDQGLTNGPDEDLSDGHVLDWHLAGPGATSETLRQLEFWALPLLVNGLATSESDAVGQIGYAITSAGRAELARRAPTEPAGLARGTREWGDLYVDLLVAELRAREQWDPENQREIWIPMSAGCWRLAPWESSPRECCPAESPQQEPRGDG